MNGRYSLASSQGPQVCSVQLPLVIKETVLDGGWYPALKADTSSLKLELGRVPSPQVADTKSPA